MFVTAVAVGGQVGDKADLPLASAAMAVSGLSKAQLVQPVADVSGLAKAQLVQPVADVSGLSKAGQAVASADATGLSKAGQAVASADAAGLSKAGQAVASADAAGLSKAGQAVASADVAGMSKAGQATTTADVAGLSKAGQAVASADVAGMSRATAVAPVADVSGLPRAAGAAPERWFALRTNPGPGGSADDHLAAWDAHMQEAASVPLAHIPWTRVIRAIGELHTPDHPAMEAEQERRLRLFRSRGYDAVVVGWYGEDAGALSRLVAFARSLGYDTVLLGIGARPTGYTDRYRVMPATWVANLEQAAAFADAVIVPWGDLLENTDYQRAYWEHSAVASVRAWSPQMPVIQCVRGIEPAEIPAYAGAVAFTGGVAYNAMLLPSLESFRAAIGTAVPVIPIVATSPYFRGTSGHAMFEDALGDRVINMYGTGIRLTGWGTQLGRNERPMYEHE